MKKVSGDLVRMAQYGQFDVIVHGCNCFCNMGAGIARSIREAFPVAYAVDCQTISGDRRKLGSFSTATVVLTGGVKLDVINAYTQFKYGRNQVQADNLAIRSVFRRIAATYGPDVRIGIPRIGAGLAGGDWGVISTIIDDEMANHNLTLVEFNNG